MTLGPPAKDATLEAKREEWVRCFALTDEATGQLDRNCIMSQVYDLVWNAAAYRVVMEGRRIADKDRAGRVMLDGLTHGLIDRCFYFSQLMAIRRLVEKQAKKPDKHVFSLVALVGDMRANRHLLTRQNLFAAFGLVMDVKALRSQWWDEVSALRSSGRDASHFRTPDPAASEQMHALIDTISGVAAESRSPSDTVADKVFETIEAHLGGTGPICDHVNKFLAHAATPESRASVNADTTRITFAEVWKAHEVICRVCQFIDCTLLRRTSHTFLPLSVDSSLLYADRPLTRTEQIPSLKKEWDLFAKEVESWANGATAWVVDDRNLAASPPTTSTNGSKSGGK